MLTAVGFGTLIEQVFGNTEHDSVHDATSSGLGSLVAIQLTHATTREFHAHVADRQLINELPRDREAVIVVAMGQSTSFSVARIAD